MLHQSSILSKDISPLLPQVEEEIDEFALLSLEEKLKEASKLLHDIRQMQAKQKQSIEEITARVVKSGDVRRSVQLEFLRNYSGMEKAITIMDYRRRTAKAEKRQAAQCCYVTATVTMLLLIHYSIAFFTNRNLTHFTHEHFQKILRANFDEVNS